MNFTKKIFRRAFHYLHTFSGFISIVAKRLIFLAIGEQSHAPIFSPIRSFADLRVLLEVGGGRKYIIKSFLYGSQVAGVNPIQSHIFRSFSLLHLRVTYFKFFDHAVSRFIRQNPRPKKSVLHDPVFILPYYNTHFGHYTGELLGQILMYESLMQQNQERKFLVVRGGEDSDSYIKKFCSMNNIKYVEPDLLLANDVYLSDAVLLPLVHPWQGMNFLKNKIVKSYIYTSDKSPGVFLTSARRERIENIDDVICFLEAKGFVVVKAQDTFCEKTLSLIKNSEICITEDATISHFVLLHRAMRYFTLSPKVSKYSGAEYFGGYVFNEYDAPRRIQIECEIVSTDKHIMSSQIRVDLNQLREEIFNLT